MSHTTILIDDVLKEQAKRAQINISQLTENAIRQKLGKQEIQLPVGNETPICIYCGTEGRKATLEAPDGMWWTIPPEAWVCLPCGKMLEHNVAPKSPKLKELMEEARIVVNFMRQDILKQIKAHQNV